MIIAIDFDGTLHTGEWPMIGQPQAFAPDALRRLKADGHYLILWTSRDGEHLINAINWLLEHNIPFDRVNDNYPENTSKYGSNSRKVFADLYIDDKQLGGLPDWLDIVERILHYFICQLQYS